MNRPGPGATTAIRRACATLTLATAATLVLLGIGVPTAAAHDALTAATPVDGATVTGAPTEVRLEFSGPVQELGTEVAVTGPDGAAVSRGPAGVDGTALIQPLRTDLPAGTYSVAWRVTSADGHPISGTTTFTVAGDAAAPGPVEEASAARPAGSSSGLAIGIGAAAVLGLALVLAARQLRGRR